VKKAMPVLMLTLLLLVTVWIVVGCGGGEPITDISQLADKTFAVPNGTVADKLVLSRLPQAKFLYVDSALDACEAVKDGKADAAAYDQPILKNIAAKNDGFSVLPQMITTDDYGFAVANEMMKRWLPEKGEPEAMPAVTVDGANGVLKFATAAVTEPFSFVDAGKNVVGFDVELAGYVAQKLGKTLEIVNMGFGDMIPAVQEGKVDMAGACITITAERAKLVLFSDSYYQGGIAALVKK
jgi:polar amino acid transport system substrate-binding protein